MREHNKRWLISVMKTSGSKRRHLTNGRFADERHTKISADLEDLPVHEPIKSTTKFYNGKINYGLLVRFLRGQIGNDWNDVYSEIIGRIPTKLLDYKEMVFWFVADKIEYIDGRLWNKKTQKFIWMGESSINVDHTKLRFASECTEFYVDPNTNKLMHIPQRSFKRISKRPKVLCSCP